MAEIGQETVKFSTLVSRTAEESYVSLKELVDKCKTTELSDSEKKINILKYLVKTQQRVLRLNVLAKWCQQVPLIQYSQQLASTLSSHDTCFTQTADSLFFMHEGLQQARAPIYDVPAAIEILLTGSYQRLPKCVEDVGVQSTLTEDQQKPALKKLDTIVRSKLLEVSVPKEISEVKVIDGTALLRVDGEFKVLVTLGYRGHLSMWRILHIELLVGERSGPVKLEEVRRHILGDDLERRMAATDNPFGTLYTVLHELCVVLVMDTVIRQVQTLRQGRWKDAIRFELISDGHSGPGGNAVSSQTSQDGEIDTTVLRTPGLKIFYWVDFDKNSGASDVGSCPFIKIEPGPDLQIKCLHSSFVVDPLRDREAELFLDQSCIDVEYLLLKAICCNRYTRLLEIYKDLGRNSHVCRAADDVFLCAQEDEPDTGSNKRDDKTKIKGKEVLCVRAYGSAYFTLGINIRNGRFLLRSSRNILASSTLLECEEALNNGSRTAADVFVSLKTKSILHLFACIGRFLGLQVYEQEFSSTRVPRNFLSGSTVLVMGFPECGSSYFLLMQLDEEFKPIFKLLETQQDLLGKAQPLVDLDHAIRVKTVDVGMMHILEDELNLSLLDSVNLLPLVGADQTPETGLLPEFSDRDSRFNSVLPSSFSSIVDELFELERGSSALNSVQSPNTMFNNSPASHNGFVARSLHGTRAGISPNWEIGSEINISTKVGNINPNYSNLPYLSSMGLSQSSSSSLQSSGPGKGLTVKKLSTSKSNQDISSLRSPYSAELGLYTTTDEDQLVSGNQLAQLSRQPVLQVSTAGAKANAPTNSLPRGSAAESLYVSRSRSLVTAPVSEGLDSAIASTSTLYIGPRQEKGSGKRTLSDMLNLVPSLRFSDVNERSSKRRKLTESSHIQQPSSQMVRKAISRTDGYDYAKLIAEANNGNATSNIYVSTLLHVVSHCSLCIKHARLTSQMEALDIPYVEEVGLRNVSSNLWFRLPFSRGDTWKHICLRLGRPGCMYWDVKINDQHFRDLWELQKGSNSTSWGSGVRIANTSDMDSHIRYDAEGVILSYNSVEADSIKKLVADIHRLSNARMFALGMRDLLGVSSEENVEDSARFHDDKVVSGVKSDGEFDKSTEQMRRTFTIEAVGLMSLWFSFGSAVLARFVVEWESGKEGCTMHVSPDQLWPHTKFLEDFINGAEVAPLLDCIRLTAGPLHALAAATRPARAAPVSGVPGITSSNTTVPKNNGYIPSKGPTTSASNTAQVPSGLGGNLGASTNTSTPSAQNLHSAAMLAAIAAAGRSGPGIVPSSLLPIDVSVVLRGPYWIRIIYRKNFAVDMRCFAGDQVWLQPATPPKGGPSAGGSLPCPQFRPFIMEHVAQELNGFDPNFTGVQQTVALGNTNNAGSGASPGPGSHMSANNGNKVGNPGSAIISRLGNQINGLGRVGNSLLTSSTSSVVGSGLPLRKSPGAVVPPHVRGELNTAIIGLGDDGGYGGGWVPLVALKKVLRGILKYLGVLWLFAQLPDLLKEILGSILKDNEGALLNLDQEQPALRFFVGGYVFAVSVHRVQLLLQVLSVKRFHHSQQQQQQNPATAQEELTQSEIGEICDYFSRRVASEPYDASRVASFITLLTLPISVLREFLKLIAWKKGLAQAQGGDVAPAQKSRIELCLENHSGLNIHGNPENSSSSKSNIHYDRPHNSVDFGLTVVLDSAHIPHLNAAGGAAWLPYCVSVRLRYSFGEKPNVSFLGMEGSHGGRACWHRIDDWDKCKQRVIRTVEMNGSSTGELNQGRLKIIADSVQRTLHVCLQGLKDGTAVSGSMVM